MERAVSAPTDQLVADWPGYEFTLPNNTFTTLLGTPHGRAIVYLITQHSRGLPDKAIESITIFTTPGGILEHDYHLLFTLTGSGNHATSCAGCSSPGSDSGESSSPGDESSGSSSPGYESSGSSSPEHESSGSSSPGHKDPSNSPPGWD